MIRMRSSAMAVAAVMWLCGSPHSANAGKIQYQQCFTARGDTVDGFKAALQAGGLFYNWGGALVNEGVLGRFGQCEATKMAPPLFRGSSATGVNSIAIAAFDNGQKVPINNHMLFGSIRNNTALDEDPMKTTFTKAGADIGTKFSPAQTRVLGDPEIIITNGGTSVMTLTALNAQINNSEDPLDPNNLFFDPDGTSVTMPTLNSSNNTLLPGDSEVFSFDIGNAVNWSFEYTFTYLGDTFTDLLATDVAVPEPSSLLLLAAGLLGLASLRRRTAHRAFTRPS